MYRVHLILRPLQNNRHATSSHLIESHGTIIIIIPMMEVSRDPDCILTMHPKCLPIRVPHCCRRMLTIQDGLNPTF